MLISFELLFRAPTGLDAIQSQTSMRSRKLSKKSTSRSEKKLNFNDAGKLMYEIDRLDKDNGVVARNYAGLEETPDRNYIRSVQDLAIIGFWDYDVTKINGQKIKTDTLKCKQFFYVPNPMKRQIS